MWRVLKFGLVTLGVVVLAIAGFFVAMRLHFSPSPPALHYAAPKDALEAQRQDLDYFGKLLAMDISFSPSERAEARNRLRSLSESTTVLPRPEFRIALMRIAALSNNGHTGMSSDPGAKPMELPARVAGFSDGIYVTHATRPYADLLGGKLVAIDGHTITEVMQRLEQLRGGVPGWRQAYAETYLSQLDLLVGTGISPSTRQSRWTVVTPAGATVTRALTAYRQPDTEPSLFVKWDYGNAPLAKLGPDWLAAQPDHPLPATFADFAAPFRRFRISCVMVVQLKTSDSEGKIKDFLGVTRTEMEASKPCAVILDNRFNDGGDYTNLAGFAGDLPKLTTGKIIVLTSPMTFSAGITTVGFVKQAGGGRVIIVGEPVGDRMAFYSEGSRDCLPHYHLCLNYRTAKHDYAHPCTNWRTCFWLDWFYPVQVESLAPDHAITMRFADWWSGRDPAYDEALALAKN
jgi:hypothetical protein